MKNLFVKFVAAALSFALMISALPLTAIALDNDTDASKENVIADNASNNFDKDEISDSNCTVENDINNNFDATETESFENTTDSENIVNSESISDFASEVTNDTASNIQSTAPLLTASSSNTYTRGYYTYTVSDGEARITDCDTSISGNITMPSTLGGTRVTYIGSSAFSGCTGLTSVTIPNSVTSIGSSAFSGCTGLTSVTIPNSVINIGSSAFSGCTGLISVTISDGVTSIGSEAFRGCTGLTSVTIPNSVTSIGSSAFSGCTGLIFVTISDGVTSIGSEAFRGCTGLTSVTIPDSVTSIGGNAFSGCSLTSVNITDIASWCKINFSWYDSNPLYYANNLYLNGSKITKLIIPNGVTSIGSYAFYNCTGLTSVTISDGVKSIGEDAFNGCTGLTSVTIPDNVTSMGSSAFCDCTGLTSVTISNGVTSIGDCAFHNCTGLTSVTIPDGVTSIGSSAFSGCTGLTSVTIPSSVKYIYSLAFDNCALKNVYITDIAAWCNIHFYMTLNYCSNPLSSATNLYLDGQHIVAVEIPDGVTQISAYAFYNFDNLISITIPKSVNIIGTKAFYGCEKIIEVINNSSLALDFNVKEIHSGNSKIDNKDGFFFYKYGNTNFLLAYIGTDTNITLPENYNGQNYEIYSYAFYGCTELTSITIPDSVTSIGSNAFSGCTGLTSVTIPDSVTSIGSYVFSCCYKLIEIINKSNLILTDVDVIEIHSDESKIVSYNDFLFYTYKGMTYLFDYVGKNTNIILPENYDGQNYEIYSHAFYNCAGLTSVTIPNSVTSIGDYAFYNCAGLTSVTIPDSVTSIGSYAFENCARLTSVTIPNSVTSMQLCAFGNCYSLKSVSITDVVAWCNISFEFDSNPLGYAKKLYLNGSLVADLVIPDSVTSIGNYAFENCELKSVTIPNSVKSIGFGSFRGCTKLTFLLIGYNVTSINSDAFYNCGKLDTVLYVGSKDDWEKIEINTTDNKSLLNAKISFNGIMHEHSYLTTIKEPTCTDGGYSTHQCQYCDYSYVASYTEPLGHHFTTDVVKPTCFNEGYSLHCCNNCDGSYYDEYIDSFLKYSISNNCITITGYNSTIPDSITIPNEFDGCAVTKISAKAFYNCSKLKEITFPDSIEFVGENALYGTGWYNSQTNGLLKIGTALYKYLGTCPDLLILSSDITSVTDNAFQNCSSLKTVNYLGTKEQWQNITIGSGNTYLTNATRYFNAHNLTVRFVDIYGNELFDTVEQFVSCGDSYSVSVPEKEYYTTEHDTVSGTMPAKDLTITVVYYEKTILSSGSCGDNITWKLYADGDLIIKGSGDMTDCGAGGAPWYANAEKVLNVNIDSRITSIGDYAFENCSNISSIDLGHSLKSIGTGAFKGCSSLKTPSFPSTVTSIGDEAFSNCPNITYVVIPDSVKSVGTRAFYNCTAIKTVKLGSEIETLGTQAFDGCTALSEIYFYGKPASATSNTFGTSNGKIIYYYNTVTGWNEQIADGKWNGYTAIPYNAISKHTTAEINPYIIKVVDKNNIPLEGATVVLGSASQVTNKDGMAYFAKPSVITELTVSRSYHNTYNDASYKASEVQLMDIVVLSDMPSVVQGVRCNENSIASSIYTLNCNTDNAVSITVSGSSKYKILKYELLQGNRILQTVSTDEKSCIFSVNTTAFEEGNNVFVKMYTADGNSVCQALNIDVVKIADISKSTLLDELSSLNMLVDLGDLGTVNLPLNFRNDSKAKIYTSVDDRTIRVGINLDVEKFVKSFKKGSDGSLKAYMQKQVDSALKKKAEGKSGVDYTVCGYLEIEYLGNDQYYVKTCYTKVAVEVNLGFEANASYFGLVGVYFKAKLSGETSLALTVSRYQPEEGFTVSDLSFAVEDKLTMEAGVYILFKFGTASLYGSGTMGFELQLIPETELKHVYFKAEAGVKWSLLWGLISGSKKIWTGTVYEWPSNYNQNTLKLMYASALYSAYMDPENYSINDRAYLDNRSEWLSTQRKLLMAMMSQSEYYDLQTNVYSGISPKVVTCGDTTVMVWLDDNANRDVSNYQTLYYSVYDKNTNTWSVPTQLDNNNTFDCEFDLYTDGEKIYVVYTEQKNETTDIEQLNIEDAEAVAAYIADIEVRYTVFENGMFSEPVSVTDNNVCEVLPSLTMIDGVLTAVWNVTDMLGLSESETKDAVYISKYIDGVWTTPVAVANNQNTVSSVAIGELSGEQYTAYITDADNSRETTDDLSLVLVNANGIASQVDTGMISDALFTKIAGKSALAWNKDGKIYYLFSVDGDIICGLPDSNFVNTDYHIITLNDGHTMLTFVQTVTTDNKDGSEVFGVYINENGYYGSVVKLTDSNGYVDHYDVTEVDGSIIIVLTDSIAEFVNENVTSTTDLRYAILDLNADIAINSLDFNISDVKIGGTFDITAEIENIGWKDINAIQVNLYDEKGQLVFTEEKEHLIGLGESVNVIIGINSPESLHSGNYVLEIVPCNGVYDCNSADNSKEIVLAFSDVQVLLEQKIIGDKTSLLLIVENDGNIATSADVFIYTGTSDGSLVDTLHIDSIEANGTLQFSVDLDGVITGDDAIITCTISSENYDPCIENNTDSISLFHVKNENYISISENTVENPELSSISIAYDKYSNDVAEITIASGLTNFVGITGLQNGIDYSVEENKIIFKKAYLSSLNLGNNELVFEFNYGNENIFYKTLTIIVSDTTPIAITGTVAISGNIVVGGTVVADTSNIVPSSADYVYQWTLDNVIVGNESSYTIPLDAYGKALTFSIIAHNGYVGEISTSGIVDYASQDKPHNPIVQNISPNSVSVAIVDGVEYSIDGISWQANGTFDNLLPAHKYSVYARYAKTVLAYASDIVEISVTTLKKNSEKATNPEIIEKTDTTVKLKRTDGYEYRCGDGEWQSSNEFVNLNPDTAYIFYQRIAETDDTYAGETSDGITVTTLIYKFTLRGTITSFGENEEPVTVKLLSQEGELIDSIISIDSDYLFEDIISGTYILEISKLNHVTRIYKITGKEGEITQNVKIHLIGDINGDGRVNITDVGKANAHAKKTSLLSGYEFDCANVNGDSNVNITDVGKINAHAKKNILLW